MQHTTAMDDASLAYLKKAADILSACLDDNLTGIYLHGSAVLGGYDAERSDLDLLIVVPRPISDEQRAAVSKALTQEALPCPAVGLEMSIVTEAVAGNPTSAQPAFELHMTTAATDSKIVDGRGHEGDPDLVLHLAVCRAHGQNLLNDGTGNNKIKSNEEVFGTVPRGLILAQLRDELQWASGDAPRHYAVLNASRAWRFVKDGQLVSKVAGGEWVLEQANDQDAEMQDPGWKLALVKAALARQGGAEAELDADDVKRFVEFVIRVCGRPMSWGGCDLPKD